MADIDSMGAGDGAGAEAPPAADNPDSSGKNIVMLSADHFPEGMQPKDGDKLTFCVTGAPDSEGNVSGYFEASGGKEGGGDTWEDEFRRHMSPTAKPEEA